MTWAAVAKYATTPCQGELYTVISQDALNRAQQRCPAGFDWTQLSADFDAMGGKLSLAA